MIQRIHVEVVKVLVKFCIWLQLYMQPTSPLVPRKPLQPDNKKHPDEEDSCSVASSYPLCFAV